MLIAAISGRALAEAAKASGYLPLVADFFGDADLQGIAERSVLLAGDFRDGFKISCLLAALQQLAQGHKITGLVCGTGFEDRPRLLEELARHWPLLGCGAENVALVKHPLHLAALCAQAGVPHPETRLGAPDDPRGWLRKQQGGAGGGHIAAVAGRAGPGPILPVGDRAYSFQRRVPGTPVSLLVLADGQRAMVLGSSAQWADPAPGEPFRYGGAVRPADIDSGILAAMEAAANRISLVAASHGEGLRGLVSLDFLVTGTGFTLLEINPRPGATLDVFSHPALMQAHVAACQGSLPEKPLAFSGAQAAAVFYCERTAHLSTSTNWPAHVKDRPNPSSPLQIGAPVCTIVARAGTRQAARSLMEQRTADFRVLLAENQTTSGEMPG